MRIIGCDLHARQQTIAMLDTDTGELEEKTLEHEGETVREFYSALPGPILVGIEATGSMQWFLELMEELGIECRVGHPQKIRRAETRKQKHDRRDARLVAEVARRESLSNDLDALERAARSAHVATSPSSVGAPAISSPAHAAIDGTQPWSQERPLAMEPSGPGRTPGIASGSSRQRATESIADFVSSLAGIHRRAGSAGQPAGPATSPGAAVNDAPGSGADHRVSHRSVPGRSAAVHRWESTGQLHRHDPERTLQRSAGSGWVR